MELGYLPGDGVDALDEERAYGEGNEQEGSETNDGEQVRCVHVVHGLAYDLLHVDLDVEQRVHVDGHVPEPGEGFVS